MALNFMKRYIAILNQAGQSAPVATILENSLGGTVLWTRGSKGEYIGTLAGAFPPAKTTVICGHGQGGEAGTLTNIELAANSPDYFAVTTRAISSETFEPKLEDNLLVRTTVSICVYE